MAKMDRPASELPPMKRAMDERVALPLDPETALKALLETDPDEIEDESD
jgi:hypothetical protein